MISIIIPCFNSSGTIARCIESCMRQSYKDIEILVIDNGSSDDSQKIVSKYTSMDKRVRLVESENGRSRARNTGLIMASGDFIQFLDADDTLAPDRFRLMLPLLNNDSIFGVCSGWTFIDDRTNKISTMEPKSNDFSELTIGNIYPINALLFRNSINNYFNDSLEYNEDWDFWVTNLENKDIEILTNNFSAEIHITGNNTMSNYDRMISYEYQLRALFKRKYKGTNVHSFIRDFKLCVNYQLLVEKNERNIEKKMGFEYLLAKVFLGLGPLRNFAKKKLENNRYS